MAPKTVNSVGYTVSMRRNSLASATITKSKTCGFISGWKWTTERSTLCAHDLSEFIVSSVNNLLDSCSFQLPGMRGKIDHSFGMISSNYPLFDQFEDRCVTINGLLQSTMISSVHFQSDHKSHGNIIGAVPYLVRFISTLNTLASSAGCRFVRIFLL